MPVEAGLYSFFDISREPADGDPSHSGESVLRAPAYSGSAGGAVAGSLRRARS